MISVSNLAKSFGDRTLFANVSFQLNAGERYGLVGANGSGKTTLIRILSGDLDASAGTVSVAKRLRLGVLRQDQFLHDDQEILAVALMGNPELILIDEPSEGLSPIIARIVFDIISEIHREGLTVVLVDQNLPYACTMADRVYIMSKGRIAYTGTGKEVMESKEIQAKFLAV